MTEPRMRLRQKGQQFPTTDLEAYLVAFGDDRDPLPETVKVLDEIVTDFIIETCHEAAACASYSRRAKIKVDDFKFMLRRDPIKLGRISELLSMDKDLKKKRKAFDTDEGTVARARDRDKDKDGGKDKEGTAEEGEGSLAAGTEGGERKKKRKTGKGARDDSESVRGR
ncbi:TFIID-18kDa-domain-containing protein [Lepidopterella palustris CBS 459.81]|uniref:Transcription initiation factor TFIID subunit 13 n=1 Tax=Lepidopterella palustris CBS 459.81 TaxID=1314670 RepID=A0A8E2EJX4_9PEZI|nr:TFIID-18kDa-domain-containing protein [Lepidopterella palustris CBS 459.81]